VVDVRLSTTTCHLSLSTRNPRRPCAHATRPVASPAKYGVLCVAMAQKRTEEDRDSGTDISAFARVWLARPRAVALCGNRALAVVQGWCKFLRGDRARYTPDFPYKSCLGRRPKTNAARRTRAARGVPPRITEPLPQLGRVGLWRRRPLTMETSKMLPIEPVGAVALIRALSWQFSRVFITLDSQHGTSLSDISQCPSAVVGA
jgi:hypothetical protein